MLFEKLYYYQVKFDNEKTYWYRSSSPGYRNNTKVIVPVSDYGIWKIGTVIERRKCKAGDVPYPIGKTKGIVVKAGWFAKSKVNHHNTVIETSKGLISDISVAKIKTEHGLMEYITCQEERKLTREYLLNRRDKVIIIENYPAASFKEIPQKAQEQVLKIRQQIIERQKCIDEARRLQREEELLRSIEFEEEMEDLDQYN